MFSEAGEDLLGVIELLAAGKQRGEDDVRGGRAMGFAYPVVQFEFGACGVGAAAGHGKTNQLATDVDLTHLGLVDGVVVIGLWHGASLSPVSPCLFVDPFAGQRLD